MKKNKLIRTSTVAISLDFLLKGQLSYLKKDFEVIAISGQDEHLVNLHQREGIRTISVSMQRSVSPLKDLRSLWNLYQVFRNEKPTIVHSITPKAGLLSMIAGKIAGVPIRIHTFTGLVFPSKSGFLKQLLITMDKILCLCATNVYPEGNGVKQDLINYKITNKPLTVLANGNVNGIDTSYFNSELISKEEKQILKNDLGITPEDFVFIFVGRLVGDKGINELIQSFKKISREKQNLKLLLVGPFESDLDPLLFTTINEIQNNSNIISVGFQKEVRPYYAISDCLVFPSYREGFPNVVLQAGAMGLPSIVTNINGCNEIIVEGENGTIIPFKNVDALYISMKKMIEDNVFRISIQQNTRSMITSRFEQSIVWNAVLAEYKRLEQNV